MLELLAEGTEPRQRWRCRLSAGQRYVLGRAADVDLPVLWDDRISRRHVQLTAGREHVDVESLPTATNPLLFDGEVVDTCRLAAGQQFVLGTTSFYVLPAGDGSSLNDESSRPGDQPIEEVLFDPRELRKVRYRNANKRIEVLSHLSEVILGARSQTELYQRLVNLILAGVTGADAAAIVELDSRESVGVLHWDRRRETAGEFRPSGRLVRAAIRNRKQSVLHVWEAHSGSHEDYTAVAEFDWAFCTPMPHPPDRHWGLYLAGRLDHSQAGGPLPASTGLYLKADVKFTELVAEIIGSVQKANELERHLSGYRQFFAPPIVEALGNDLNTDILEPRECDVTVLFCDLRGFSRRAEESAADLLGLLDRVSRALEVMTEQILRHGGVTGDFQGDAALAFWGWPFASDSATIDACRAALGIRAAFAKTFDLPDHPLARFRVGIGIAHGRAVAGKIGTSEQVKVTVFGPVVNLASRLEGMTKFLRVPIVVDEATAEIVRERFDPGEGRIRRLSRVLPYGMETPLTVSELLPSASKMPELSESLISQFEEGVELFIAGRWEEAYQRLHAMPPEDRAQDFLSMQIAQHNRVAPADWNGVIRLPNK